MFIPNLHYSLQPLTPQHTAELEPIERVSLVYFSAQLTMIFHPITTMSCIKLI
jgi:hypothetical protein